MMKACPAVFDGCGAPNYALPLSGLAHAYARLATHAPGSEQANDLDTLYSAMTSHPEMVSGEARDDLVLAEAAPADWIAKGVRRRRAGARAAQPRPGIALKIADGNRRALQTAVAAVLGQLGLLPAGGDHPLSAWQAGEIRNYAGTLTGRFVSVFKLA